MKSKLFSNLSYLFVNLFRQPALILSIFQKNDGITKLTDTNFDQVIMNSSDVWVVEYFAAWCPACKSFTPEMEKLGRIKDKFEVAAIDADLNKKIGDRYFIRQYPTIKIFGKNKNTSPVHYGGRMRAEDIASMAKKLI